MTDRKKITVSVISELATDQRVIRICNTLQDMGFDVHVYARKNKNSLPLENYSFTAKRLYCFFDKGVMLYAEFMTKLFFKLLFTKTDYFLANDLDALVPTYLVSKLRQKYLFYDTHEYFTGVPELRNSPVKKRVWEKLEDWILPQLKTVYTVNDSVKNEYQKKYDIPFSIIRNVPVSTDISPAPLPEQWRGRIILLAQGVGLNEGRSCIEMIDTMPLLDDRFHLVFIGGGTAWQALQQRRKDLQLEDRITMWGRMLPSKLKSFTSLAHLGISLDSFNDKNCLFNLPNKIFDYLQAGVPVFATAIPEIKKIVDEYRCGICITDTSPENISNMITNLFNDDAFYQSLKQNAIAASKILCWEKEQEKLKEIYRPFL